MAWPLLFLAVGLGIAHYPMVFSGFRRMESGLYDARFNNYVLEHNWLWLTGFYNFMLGVIFFATILLMVASAPAPRVIPAGKEVRAAEAVGVAGENVAGSTPSSTGCESG